LPSPIQHFREPKMTTQTQETPQTHREIYPDCPHQDECLTFLAKGRFRLDEAKNAQDANGQSAQHGDSNPNPNTSNWFVEPVLLVIGYIGGWIGCRDWYFGY